MECLNWTHEMAAVISAVATLLAVVIVTICLDRWLP